MSNPWNRLQSLLPRDVMQIGTVLADNADGTSDVELLGGGRVTVSGSGYAVDDRVFVLGGLIRGEAPDLTPTDIEV